jgi:sugar phosphate isomerase/epimerase
LKPVHTSPDIPLSLAHLSELDVPPGDLIELAAGAGFASIGLRTCRAAPGGVQYELATQAEQADMRRRIAATGVSVLYIEMVGLSETTRVSDYRAMLETGAAIGASRLAVGGDSADVAVVAEKFAAMCDLAKGYGIAVDLEFMPFRGIRSLSDAVAVVRSAARRNGHILVDALHVFRSGSSLDELAALDPALLGTFQICDAPAQAPVPEELVTEARTRRLLPGHGGLPLEKLIAALPKIPFGIEVPLAGQRPDLDPAARLALLTRTTREFLQQRDAKENP